MVPKHIGIILDGNRRYAKSLGLKPWEGHKKGAERVEEIIAHSISIGVKELTLYTFSKENFNRDKVEIEFIFKVFKGAFEKFFENKEIKGKARIQFCGDKSLFPKEIQKLMGETEEKTKNNNSITVNLAMGYGGRMEIINAVKKIVIEKIDPEDIDEKLFSENLYVKDDVDLIIRTSGEKRLSGFLPWQGVYAELIFVDKLWPEFTKEDLDACIGEFNNRKRRFGQ